MNDRELQERATHNMQELTRYLMKNRASSSWSTIYDVRGQAMSQRWPGRVPYTILLHERESMS